MSAWWAVLLASWFMLVAAFFVVVETSLLAARPERLEDLARRDGQGADELGSSGVLVALAAVRAPDRPLATAQVGISAASVLLGWAVAPVLGEPVQELLEVLSAPVGWSTPIGLVVGLVLVSVVHLVVGESVPRALALAAPERAARVVLPVHRVIVVVLRPVAAVLFGAARAIARALGVTVERGDGSHTTEQLAVIVGESAEGGELADTERELLRGVLSFHDVKVADVMAPREELVTVPHVATVAQAEELVHRSGHSRVLVVDDDQVTGFLHVKDLIALGPQHQPELLPPGLVRVALRVGPEDPLDAVLLRMRRARRHVAVVLSGSSTDAGVVGLVTLEDILEVLVGDIRDETDREEPA